MKIDFSKPILDLSDKPLMVDDQTLTLRTVASNALLFPSREGEDGNPDEAVKKFALAMEIYKSKTALDVKVEDAALIKKMVPKLYGPLVIGRVYEAIEGKP